MSGIEEDVRILIVGLALFNEIDDMAAGNIRAIHFP
jgi:hypothetical protein